MNAPPHARADHVSARTNGELVLHALEVSKAYGHRPVLRAVSFRLHAGQRLALTGPSGSGKTTLLNCLGGVDRPDSGSILLRGQPLERLSSDALARVRRRRVGTVFQFFHLLPTLTAFENVEFPLQLNGVPADQRQGRVQSLLERVNLGARARAFPAQLSGGEMQRVAIARALVHQPDLILADEPTGNLDSANGENILALLHDLTEETATALVLVTHSLEATRICHRTIHLRDGAVVSETEHA
ncbi:MAG: ABC transporter ATP-binding protein [Verrucomicrobia bacterium]|nr:ABC transporter ATP-binding protein [Verrucomicrobiota bacterium]